MLHVLIIALPLHPHFLQPETPAQTALQANFQQQPAAIPLKPAPAVSKENRKIQEHSTPTKTVPQIIASQPAPSPLAQEVSAPAPPAAAAAIQETPANNSNTHAPEKPSLPRFDAAYLNNPKPNYPALSRRLSETGKVLLKVKVSTEGQAVAVDIAQSSNSTRLDEAARQAVKLWRFVPAKLGDQPVAAEIIVPIVFKLED